MPHQISDRADEFYRALTSGDTAACAQMFAVGAVVWHNYDLVEQSPAEALAPVAAMSALLPRFEVVERLMLSDGWLQQHRFHFAFPDGDELVLAAIQRTRLRDGLISRVDEYMDTAQLGAIVQKAQSTLST